MYLMAVNFFFVSAKIAKKIQKEQFFPVVIQIKIDISRGDPRLFQVKIHI